MIMVKKSGPASVAEGKVIAVNKKARFDYHIIETYEAGVVLTGMEIKSIRAGNINLQEGYIRPAENEMFLLGVHIRQYSHSGGIKEYDPVRSRKLLLHKHEIDKLRGRVEAKGMTIVPLKLYLKQGRAKLEIGLAKGKDSPDKRKSIKDRDVKRDIERALKTR
jgi:SsrA-binding protein